MITITFPDGKTKSYDKGISGLKIASDIGTSFAKRVVAMKTNGILRDLTSEIHEDVKIEFVTQETEEGLDIIRHDAAHVFAEAVKELYPEAQITIGPSIENGFYYDIYREKSIVPEDLEIIEKRMREIVDRDEPITREVWTREKAIEFFKSIGEHFKVELIESIPGNEELTVYKQGNFADLCRGPHLPSTKRLGKAFKLMKIAGAYWRGDSNNPMLQRIYGTAWHTEDALKEYLHQLEEAEKRDHRKIGKEMDLFHLQEEAPGGIFWHPNGWVIYQEMQQYIRRKLNKAGYKEINTPMLVDKSLWEASGHWDKFGSKNMFSAETENKTYVVKPMNCPCHIQIFKQGLKSYRDLPLRLAEFGTCHRNEPSGSLHGIMRVRGFVQDDAHIFCTVDQIVTETVHFCKLLKEVYNDFGFEEIKVRFSDRPEVRGGDDALWDKAEKLLIEAVEAAALPYTPNPGEGAFYGPKLEFVLKDAIGREWQCGTLQLDFVLPERLDASYIGEDGAKHRPVMLHRAILGTFERFMGVLIEQYAGRFPLWLSPVQTVVACVTRDTAEYAQEVAQELEEIGIRVETDLRNEKINYKIRELSLQKTPYIAVVGKKEAETKQVSIRKFGSEEQRVVSLEEFKQMIFKEAQPPA